MPKAHAISRLDVTIGRILRVARQQRDWSVADLAQRTGLTPSTIQRYEQGMMQISFGTAHLLAAALDTDLIELLRRTGSETIRVSTLVAETPAKAHLQLVPKEQKFMVDPNQVTAAV